HFAGTRANGPARAESSVLAGDTVACSNAADPVVAAADASVSSHLAESGAVVQAAVVLAEDESHAGQAAVVAARYSGLHSLASQSVASLHEAGIFAVPVWW